MATRTPRIPTTLAGSLTAAALLAAAGVPAPAAAQHPQASGPVIEYGDDGSPATTTPAVAHVGDLVQLRPKHLPADKPIQIMLGAVQQGFEVVAELATDQNGRVGSSPTLGFQVPDWVRSDRPYMVIVSDRYYKPLAPADYFHPTAADGSLSREGVVSVEGGCTILVDDQKARYLLTGEVAGLTDGDRVTVSGTATTTTTCGPAIGIRVGEVARPQRP